MRNRFLSRDYKEELANIAETKGFSNNAENLLLSMAYKLEDGYDNYQIVKREVPNKYDFIDRIVKIVREDCDYIEIAEPNSELEKELKKNKCRVMTEKDTRSKQRNVITYPNEKTLLYGLTKVSLPPMRDNLSIEEQAIFTAVNIGRCISTSEAIRDFSGWTWSILESEIESTECNIIYIFLSLLLGHEFLENCDVKKIEKNLPTQLFYEIKKVATQFYMSYDQKQNEQLLKTLYKDKKTLEKMKKQSEYIIEIAEKKKRKLLEIKQLDEILSNPRYMKQEYIEYNSKMPNEKKVFSVSHYEEMLQKRRIKMLNQIEKYNKMQNPVEYVREKERLEYKIKFYEEKTDITKLQKEFLKCFEQRINATNDRRGILDIIYEIRYLHFIPNCKMKLTHLEQLILPKAIQTNVIAPISNNNTIDYRILKGIFKSQVMSLENLTIRLSSVNSKIHVEIFDGEMIDSEYDVALPEGSTIEIRRTKKMKIFG
ncbi:MAG: hypothetical protein IKG14_05125 [Clostridia bacterium]|nr:hypothetical protein [Clostridia bacterium]